MQNWSNILESFITILYDFEKQWLSSFACKAIVIRLMVGGMVKNSVGQGRIFHVIIPALCTF